jgi:hypothetical protein
MKNAYDISADGTTATIWLKRRAGERIPCLVDAADLPKLKTLQHSWHAHWDAKGRCFYIQCNVPVNGITTRSIIDAAIWRLKPIAGIL